MPPRGRITGSKVAIPPARLSPGNLFSRDARLLNPDEIRALNSAHAEILDLYGLSLAACRTLPLRRPARPARGPLEEAHRLRLALAAAIAALAVTATGRGALLDLPPGSRARSRAAMKERNDRAAACALAEGLFDLSESAGDAVCEIAIGEGVRRKADERGSNPTLYAGQVLGPPGLASLTAALREARGVRTWSAAVDAVEGTTKSTVAEGSSGCLFYITEAAIRRVPDVYFNRCHLVDVDGVNVDSELGEIFDAVRSRRGSDQVDVFSLDRPRHPHALMADLGANVRTDADGDAFPVVASGLRYGVFPDDGRPLDGVCGNIGGAAEVIASSAAGHYLGVQSTARFAAGRIDRWEDRYRLTPSDLATVHGAGFDPETVYRIEDLVPGIDQSDGLFVASAISDNAHIPLFDAVFWGSDFAEASVLTVGASGAAELLRMSLAFKGDAASAAQRLTPILESILSRPEPQMAPAIRQALSSPSGARRLRHEFAATYYAHFRESGGRFRLDMKSAEAEEPGSSLGLLRGLIDLAPEWFD